MECGRSLYLGLYWASHAIVSSHTRMIWLGLPGGAKGEIDRRDGRKLAKGTSEKQASRKQDSRATDRNDR